MLLDKGGVAGRPCNPVRSSISYTPRMEVWEFVFMMLVLKIPIVYLCLVVYWAVKAEPTPPEPSRTGVAEPEPPESHSPWTRPSRRRGPRRGPLRGPQRTATRARRAAVPE